MGQRSVTDKQQYLISITIIGALFFIFGFVTWLNGILIPYLKIACELSNFEALFVAFSFYISYTFMALPSSWVLKKTGFKRGMMTGLLVMAAGALLFIPAAMTRTYGLFLGGLFVMGTGLAILQTASNPYITIIGPVESAAKRISIMGICNKLAGAIAPLILAYFILGDIDAFKDLLAGMDAASRLVALDGLAARVIVPYLFIAGILVFLGLMILFSPLPDIESEQGATAESLESGSKKNILQFPHLVLGAIALFFYVGAEVVAGDTIISYGDSLNIPLSMAKAFTTYTLIAMVIGYIFGIILIPRYISQRTALLASSVLGLVLSVLALLVPGTVSVALIAALGLANALVWPAIWPLAIHNLGPFIKTGSAILIMAIAGGAILPLAWGRMADLYSPQMAYIILIPCYLIIFFYAGWWYKLKSWK